MLQLLVCDMSSTLIFPEEMVRISDVQGSCEIVVSSFQASDSVPYQRTYHLCFIQNQDTNK